MSPSPVDRARSSPGGPPTSPAFDARALAERVEAGVPRAVARAISHVENERPGFEALLDRLHARVGSARRIGITGPPGAGKSTLTAVLTRRYLDDGLTVGIIAVDPTSPFTGGALLGDRIRMSELATEEGVFIRSMASRGSLGGLATATREAADILDAAGYDRVLLETLGVGQSELDIAVSADTTAVVLVPESGDGIQAMKAGLMEVADLFVVNKADRPGADRLENEIRVMMAIREGNAIRDIATHHGARIDRPPPTRPAAGATGSGGPGEPASEGRGSEEDAGREPWRIPVLQTVASAGDGVEELAAALEEHHEWLVASEELDTRRRERLVRRAHDALLRSAQRDAERVWRAAGRVEVDGESPYAIARRLYERWRSSGEDE